MMENIANEDLKVEFSNISGPPDLVYTTDQPIDLVKIIPGKSLKAKINNKAVCNLKVDLTFTLATPCPHTSATHVFVSGMGIMITSATKCRADGITVLRENDSGTCLGSWTNSSTGAPVPCSCDLKISDAGQNKVKGD